MARENEAQRIERANFEAALERFSTSLQELGDPRRRQGLRYPLETVIVSALMAMVAGCDDAEAMAVWSEANEDWLGTFLRMPHGAPSQDVYLHVFAGVEPSELNRVVAEWVNVLRSKLEEKGAHIAIDGKTSRRSADRATDKPAIHTVSAWLSGAGLVLGQVKTDDKSNEITAIPELLRTLDLRGMTVTIDAMGCQRKIASCIKDRGGEYILSVKANQPALYSEVRETFREASDNRLRTVDEEPQPTTIMHEDIDKGHGRLELRRVRVTECLTWVPSREAWKGLTHLVEVTRERTVLRTGSTSVEKAYFVASGPTRTPQETAELLRRHWSIENNLHWVLDMAFAEDQARHRAGNAAANMTTLRHMALNLINQDPDRKLGVANSRKRAGFDRRYLLKIISGAVSA
jgi:predicted transposase YbfD/YdcC